MRLLERDLQLTALSEYAREAAAGQGRLVLIAGEAGIGKSSLVDRLRASLTTARWVEGACDGLFTPRPLGPLLDVAEQVGGELAELCRRDSPREQLFGGLLRELVDPATLNVLVIEDIHWADEATLDLLRFLGRRIRDACALVLVTYRDEQLAAGDALRVALGQLATQRTVRRLDLPPLSPAAVEELAAGSGIEPEQLHRITGGNPFYLTELLRQQSIGLPASARDAVLARAATVGPEARRVLDVAALMGTRIEPQLLVGILDCTPAGVDELVTHGLLVSEDGQLRFRHEIARLAVDSAIPAHRRPEIHRAILLGLLAARSDQEARLAYHSEGAGEPAFVLHWAPRAARRASQLAAHREAVAQYRRALRFADDTDARTRAELCDALAYEESLLDHWQDSAQIRFSALELWREVGDQLREGDTLRWLSRALWRLCRGPESRAAAEEAVAVLEGLGPSVELSWAYAAAAFTRMGQSRSAEAIALARRAQQLAEHLGAHDALSDALNTEASAMPDAEPGSWLPPLLRALEIALEHGLDEQAGRAYANIYTRYCEQHRFEAGEPYFIDGVAFCDEHDVTTFASCLRGERTASLIATGRWAEAEALAASLLDRVSPSPINRLNPLISLGSLRARCGTDSAWSLLDEAVALADEAQAGGWIALARMARAEAYWIADDAAAATAELRLASLAGIDCDPETRSEIAVWTQRISGTRPPAVDALSAKEPLAQLLSADFAAAARIWDTLGCRYDAALARADSTDEHLLRAALAELEELGATATARKVRHRMRDLGVRSIPAGTRAATRAHPAGLTRRQHEVLELLCAGRTNDEIAGRLCISIKTVDHHVSAVLDKLGVPTRKLAAAEALSRGLIDVRVR